MSLALTGRKRKDTYTWLLQMQGNGATLDPDTPVTVCFGDGTPTPLAITSTALYVNGEAVPTAAMGAGIPESYAAATLSVDPAGANNAYLLTAVTKGHPGNLISHTLAAPVAGQTATLATLAGTDITVTPGTKARITTAGTTPALPECFCVPYSGFTIYTSDGISNYANGPSRTAWYTDGSTWYVWSWNASSDLVYAANITSAAASPDLIVGSWTVTTGSEQPVITAATSSAAQCIAAINAATAVAALVTATPQGTVTGSVAALAKANLSGGAGTPGRVGSMSVSTGCLYLIDHLDGDGYPVWQSIPLPAPMAVTLTAPAAPLSAFDPATATVANVTDMLAQLLIHLQTQGLL